MARSPEIRTYKASEVAGFCRTADAHGGLSNMAGGYPIPIGEAQVRSTEAYYQAMRYPHNPQAQAEILAQTSPMFAKRKAYEFIDETRTDWGEIRVPLMKHALCLKLAMNRDKVLGLYDDTKGLPIVEISNRDSWWGAVPDGKGSLQGCNVLGRLHMWMRMCLEQDRDFCRESVASPRIPDLVLLGVEIGDIVVPENLRVEQFRMEI